MTAGSGKRGGSGPGPVSLVETASASCFGRMTYRDPGDKALALLPEASVMQIRPDILGKSAARRQDGHWGLQPWCHGRHIRCDAETYRAHPYSCASRSAYEMTVDRGIMAA